MVCVIVMDMVASRLEFCRSTMGVKHTVQAGDDNEEKMLRDLTDGHLPTIVIDAKGIVQGSRSLGSSSS